MIWEACRPPGRCNRPTLSEVFSAIDRQPAKQGRLINAVPLAPEASASKLSSASSVNNSTSDATARQHCGLGIDLFGNVEPERVTMSGETLRIGIASRDQLHARTIALARGELKPRPDDPKVWFTSLESLAQVLSSKNQLLLEIIERARPASITELAKLSGRQQSNVTRTLRTMERYQLVALKRSADGKKVPSVPYQRASCEFELCSGQIGTGL
jgi:predicted transcriptional regulator